MRSHSWWELGYKIRPWVQSSDPFRDHVLHLIIILIWKNKTEVWGKVAMETRSSQESCRMKRDSSLALSGWRSTQHCPVWFSACWKRFIFVPTEQMAEGLLSTAVWLCVTEEVKCYFWLILINFKWAHIANDYHPEQFMTRGTSQTRGHCWNQWEISRYLIIFLRSVGKIDPKSGDHNPLVTRGSCLPWNTKLFLPNLTLEGEWVHSILHFFCLFVFPGWLWI